MKKLIFTAIMLLSVSVIPKCLASWSIETNMNTTAADKHDGILDRQYEYGLNVGYDFTPNFYSSAEIQRYPGNTYGYQALFGAHDSGGYIRPYAEVAYVSEGNSVSYDVGVTLNAAKHFVPFVEIDNILDKSNKSVALGATINFTKHSYMRASYEITKSSAANNVSVSVGYLI